MHVVTDEIDVTPEAGAYMLRKSTEDCGVFINLDRVLEIQSAASMAKFPYERVMRFLSGNSELTANNYQLLKTIYSNRFGVPVSKLMEGAGKKTAQDLFKDEESSEDLKQFALAHFVCATLEGKLKNIKQYIDLPMCREKDRYGNRMVVAKPTYEILATSRLQANSPSIQNIQRELCDIITEPKGYRLYRSDSGQIEPRIMYSHFIKDPLIKHLILLYDDAYYGLLHYITRTKEEEAIARKDLNAIVKLPFTRDERQDLKLAGLAAGYGSNLQGKDVPYAKEYVEKINNHPLRMEWQRTVEEQVRRGIDTFETPFGLVIAPEETDKYKRGETGWLNHIVRCGINNPIQATASQLMLLSVGKAYNIFMNRKSKIAYYKHDEGAFYLHDDEQEEMIERLQGIMEYQVRDWIPIKADYLLGVKEGDNFGMDNTIEGNLSLIQEMGRLVYAA